ncbi:uncharacterized protein ZBAI_03060 [Zygosaccharomyces bailii ISA1307]|nr:uncharacterized protein ZBAI_03060 [Zygosaccharomyces bailii ISA1307]
MSTLGPEIETVISEDYGFKKLGQTTILPSYDEKLPFACLQNLDISNTASLYVACSGSKIVIGSLQLLRDYIQNDSKFDLTFLWEREAADVIAVKLIRGDNMVFVNRSGHVFLLDLKKLGDPQRIGAFDRSLEQVKIWRNCALLALDSQNQLCSYHLEKKHLAPLVDDVVSFDLLEDQLYTFHKDYSVQIHVMQNFQATEKKEEFSTPSELLEEIKDEYSPISISALSNNQYQLVYGIPVAETEEDVSYDHKIYVVSRSGADFSFQESFDITPAFGSVLRFPTYYTTALPKVFEGEQQIDILASSCSSEVTVWDSERVIQPAQDSERAVLPISKVTDNDTNPVGIALDVVTEGTIAEPCPGVDAVDKLPLVYILNNEGSLQIVGIYHSTAIKQGKLSLTALKQSLTAEETAEEIGQDAINKPESQETSNDIGEEKATESLAGFNLGGSGDDSRRESNTVFGEFGLKDSEKQSGTAAFGKSLSESTGKEQNTSQTSTFGKPTFGKPAFGTAVTSNLSGRSPFGKPAFGTVATNNSSGETPFGKPAFGQPSFGQSSFGQQSFSLTNKNSPPANSSFGKPSFQLNSRNSSTFGSSSFGQSSSNQSSGIVGSPFGKFTSDQSKSESPFASLAKNKNQGDKPAFGIPSKSGSPFASLAKRDSKGDKPTFGVPSKSENPFGSLTKDKNQGDKPAFGIASFGENTRKNESSDKPKFGQSPFSNFASGTSNTESPFGSLSHKEKSSTFGTPSFGSGAIGGAGTAKPAFGQSTFGAFANNQSKGESPFASLARNETKNIFSRLGTDHSTEQSNYSTTPIDTNSSITETVSQTLSRADSQKEENMEATDGSTSSSDVDAQHESADSRSQSSVTEKLHDNEPSLKNEPSTITKKGDINTEEPSKDNSNEDDTNTDEEESHDVDVSEMNEKEERSGEDRELKAQEETPNTDLSDSTVEQTPTQSESSISSLTARIKESANLSSDEIKSPTFSQPLAQEKIQSPFAKFANDLSKPSSTGFLFSQTPGANKNKDSSKEPSTKADKLNDETQNPYSAHKDAKESKCRTLEDEKLKESGKKSSDQKKTDAIAVPELLHSGDKERNVTPASHAEHSVNLQPTGGDEEGTAPKDSPTSLSGASREESYDTLDDITRGELENARVHGNGSTQSSKAEAPMKTNVPVDSEGGRESSKRHFQMQTSSPTLVNSGTQVVRSATQNAECQTDPEVWHDSNIQSFEGEDAHLAVQHKPKPLPDYFLGADIKNIKYASENPILKAIEKTYHYVSSELSVLSENVSNIGNFIDDQSADYSLKRDESSITNMYTWRIPEASKLWSIIDGKKELFDSQFSNVSSTHDKISQLSNTIDLLQCKASYMKDEYYNLESLNQDLNRQLGELKYHQRDKQTELRDKMFKVSESIEHIDGLLQILKMYAIRSKGMDTDPHVTQLVKEAESRTNLLHNISCLREDIKNLGLEKEHLIREKEGSPLGREIQSVEVVELGLSISTKKQLGELLKKRKNIEV